VVNKLWGRSRGGLINKLVTQSERRAKGIIEAVFVGEIKVGQGKSAPSSVGQKLGGCGITIKNKIKRGKT